MGEYTDEKSAGSLVSTDLIDLRLRCFLSQFWSVSKAEAGDLEKETPKIRSAIQTILIIIDFT